MLDLTDPLPMTAPDDEVAGWAASGAMALTGRIDEAPLGPPRGFVPRLRQLGRAFGEAAAVVDAVLDVDPLALLGERAAIGGLHRRGATSVGGATRLLTTSEGWLAVSLARPDDVALVPAWLEVDEPTDPWSLVEAAVREHSAVDVVDRARFLGLPAAVLGEATGRRPPIVREARGAAEPVGRLADVMVVELASLWAGPLCGSLLRQAGATVIKVESAARPDGARRGPAAFFDLLNAGKESVALDLQTADGVAHLERLLESAHVVIEGSRPRALEQLGVHLERVLDAGGLKVWLSITGHGRAGPAGDWVAFGDDAAVAGGLVARDERGPVFCADAVADPLTAMVAATAVLDALAEPHRSVVDVALSAVAAAFAGPTLPVPEGLVATDPGARSPLGPGPSLGSGNARAGFSGGSGT